MFLNKQLIDLFYSRALRDCARQMNKAKKCAHLTREQPCVRIFFNLEPMALLKGERKLPIRSNPIRLNNFEICFLIRLFATRRRRLFSNEIKFEINLPTSLDLATIR